MQLDFRPVLALIGTQEPFRIINSARTPADYALSQILPEVPSLSYKIDLNTLVVRTTMAGLTPMDNPYFTGGMVEMEGLKEETLKLTLKAGFGEKQLRALQQIAVFQAAAGRSPDASLVDEVLNFHEKVIVQGHFDATEYLRGLVLTTGQLVLEQNGVSVNVDYGVPAENLFATRTGADAYGSTDSKFWEDMRKQRKILGRPAARIAHGDTIADIVDNPANNIRVEAEGDTWVRLRRYREIQGNTVVSEDTRDTVVLIEYNKEGEVLRPDGTTIKVPFLKPGYVVAVGRAGEPGYMPGQGSIEERPDSPLALGYTHLAPTVEGGEPGRWSNVFTPQETPYTVQYLSAANLLPVLIAPKKLCVASTEIQG